jgi:hypothetical protein
MFHEWIADNMQYLSKDELKLNVNGTSEPGQLFMEATFISE